MHSFKDTAGREWHLTANYANYARVKSAVDVKLYDIGTEDRKSLVQLADDFTLGAVLWSMIEPQAEARGLTPEQFYETVDGTVLREAHSALIDEMIFFCHPHQRRILEAAVRKLREAEAKAEKTVDRLIPMVEAEMDAAIEQLTHGNSDMSSPESWGSTLPNGPSESSIGPSEGGSEKPGTIRLASLHNSPKSTATPKSDRGRSARQKSTR